LSGRVEGDDAHQRTLSSARPGPHGCGNDVRRSEVLHAGLQLQDDDESHPGRRRPRVRLYREREGPRAHQIVSTSRRTHRFRNNPHELAASGGEVISKSFSVHWIVTPLNCAETATNV